MKGQKFLKVTGILMIIGAALSILFGVIIGGVVHNSRMSAASFSLLQASTVLSIATSPKMQRNASHGVSLLSLLPLSAACLK